MAYAVPSNPGWNATGLANFYDTQAQDYYANFTKSLAQIACNTTGTAQYSLAKNCTDCANDYKNWLCSVLIPRCEDYSSTALFLQPRNIAANFTNGTTTEAQANFTSRSAFNQSRNPLIDTVIKPGPYKEVLPCDDLCYAIVRSCPAKLGFSCPQDKNLGMSYAPRAQDPTVLQCNYPGVFHIDSVTSEATSKPGPLGLAYMAVLVALLMI